MHIICLNCGFEIFPSSIPADFFDEGTNSSEDQNMAVDSETTSLSAAGPSEVSGLPAGNFTQYRFALYASLATNSNRYDLVCDLVNMTFPVLENIPSHSGNREPTVRPLEY